MAESTTKDEQTTVASEPSHSAPAHAPKKKNHHKVIIAVLIALVAIILACGIALMVFLNIGKSELMESSQSGSFNKTMHHDGKLYKYNEDIVSVAIIGTDRLYGYVSSKDDNGHADAVLVLAYNTANGDMTLINAPRNLYLKYQVFSPDGVSHMKNSFLSVAYAYGSNDAEGAENVCGALSRLFGNMPMNNYVTILESAVAPLAEAIGGVTVTALEDVRGGLKKGETYTLTGDHALWYVQYRNTEIRTSPADRSKRQQQFAKAFLDQAIEAVKKDPSVIGRIYDIITDPQYMTTNLTLNEIGYLASAVIQNGVGDLNMVTIPFDEEYDEIGEISAYYPREDEVLDLLLDVYYEPVE